MPGLIYPEGPRVRQFPLSQYYTGSLTGAAYMATVAGFNSRWCAPRAGMVTAVSGYFRGSASANTIKFVIYIAETTTPTAIETTASALTATNQYVVSSSSITPVTFAAGNIFSIAIVSSAAVGSLISYATMEIIYT